MKGSRLSLTSVRQGSEPPRRRRLVRIVGVSAAILAMAGLSAFAVAVSAYNRLQGNINKVDIKAALGTDRPTAAPAPTGTTASFNLLVLGSDTRDGKNGFIGGAKDGGRSDTAMLLHVSAGAKWASVISIPRDSMVNIPKCKRADGSWSPATFSMFNSAYASGGAACTIRTVESLTDIRVDHYVEVNFYGFKNMVNALGGVEVCSPQDVHSYGVTVKKGLNHVDGQMALDYVRLRHGIGDNSDLGRLGRQQAFVSSILQKLSSAGTLTDPVKIYDFLSAGAKSLTMDTELAQTSTLMSLAVDVKQIGLKNIQFLTVPVGAWSGDPKNKIVWTSEAATLWQAIRQDQPISSVTTPRKHASTPSNSAGPSPAKVGGKKAAVLSGVTVRTATTNICQTGA
jgi:LCP family protein required for cell wall assembly